MVCLLAFLLYTGTYLPQKDRFIITSTEFIKPSYHSYEVNYEQPFPVPEKNSGIYRTLIHIDGPGTYLTVYCSIKVTIGDLREFVSKGLASKLIRFDRGFSNDEIAEDECFHHVNNLYRAQTEKDSKLSIQDMEELEPNPLPVSSLIQSHKCTKSLLVSLAFQRRISCADGHGLVTKYLDKNLPTIKFDQPLEIAALMPDGQIIMRKIKDKNEGVLGWNQGQLQVFTRLIGKNWSKSASVVHSPTAGWVITELVRKSYAPVRKFMDNFTTPDRDKNDLSECLGLQRGACLSVEACRKFKRRKLRVELTKLSPLPVDGYLNTVQLCKMSGK